MDGTHKEGVYVNIPHRVTIHYYTSDDGIWLECDCGWRKNIDWSPPPQTALLEEMGHLREVLSETEANIRFAGNLPR